MDIRERLRTAVDLAAARSSVTHLSPEEFFAAIAEGPKPTSRKLFTALASGLSVLVMFVCLGWKCYLMMLPRDSVPLEINILATVGMFFPMTLFRIVAATSAARSNRWRYERRFPALLLEKANALTQGFAAADLIRFSRHGAIDADVTLAVRDALVRLLPRVTSNDAVHFTRAELEFLRDNVAGGDARLKDPTPEDDDLAVACWLALSSLAGADAMDSELYRALRRDARRVTERGRTEHLRATAGEFAEQAVTVAKGR